MSNSFNNDYNILILSYELERCVNYVSVMENLIFFASLIDKKDFQGFEF